MSKAELNIIESALDKLIKSGAVKQCVDVQGQFLSSFFTVPKPDGSARFILNLKKLNKFILDYHFKIEDLRTATNLLRKKYLMCRLDLKDAYFSVSICKNFRKFLRFKYRDKLFEFRALPFGLSSSPYIFTKIMKPVVTYLRKLGIIVVIYLDDFLIIADSKESCLNSLNITINLLEFLGFTINFEKSQLIPVMQCKFLGVILNSLDMILELPLYKKLKIKNVVIYLFI